MYDPVDYNLLSEDEILEGLHATRGREVKVELKILRYLNQVRRRQLDLSAGFSNLWKFCVDQLDYTRDEAFARSKATEITLLGERVFELFAGRQLSITCLKHLYVAFAAEGKRRRKIGREALAREEKLAIVERVSGKSTRDVLRSLADLFPELERNVVGTKALSGGRTQMTIVFEEEQTARFTEFRNQQAHKLDDYEPADVFDLSLIMALRQPTPREEKVARPNGRTDQSTATESTNAELARTNNYATHSPASESPDENLARANTPVPPPPAENLARANTTRQRRKYQPVSLKRAINEQCNGQCEYVDPRSGRRCDSRFALQNDHINPVALGGGEEPTNFRKLCAAHNRFAADRMGFRRPLIINVN